MNGVGGLWWGELCHFASPVINPSPPPTEEWQSYLGVEQGIGYRETRGCSGPKGRSGREICSYGEAIHLHCGWETNALLGGKEIFFVHVLYSGRKS